MKLQLGWPCQSSPRFRIMKAEAPANAGVAVRRASTASPQGAAVRQMEAQSAMTASHGIPIVDAHQHFWGLTHHRYPWLDPGTQSLVGDPSPIGGDYTPDDYLGHAGPI